MIAPRLRLCSTPPAEPNPPAKHSEVCMCDACVSERQREQAVDELQLAEIFRKAPVKV